MQQNYKLPEHLRENVSNSYTAFTRFPIYENLISIPYNSNIPVVYVPFGTFFKNLVFINNLKIEGGGLYVTFDYHHIYTIHKSFLKVFSIFMNIPHGFKTYYPAKFLVNDMLYFVEKGLVYGVTDSIPLLTLTIDIKKAQKLSKNDVLEQGIQLGIFKIFVSNKIFIDNRYSSFLKYYYKTLLPSLLELNVPIETFSGKNFNKIPTLNSDYLLSDITHILESKSLILTNQSNNIFNHPKLIAKLVSHSIETPTYPNLSSFYITQLLQSEMSPYSINPDGEEYLF